MRLSILAAAGLLATVTIASGMESDGKGAEGGIGDASFVDRFERLSPKRWMMSDGWTNGPHQGCIWSKGNVEIQKSGLLLTLKKKGEASAGFTCAEIQTQNTFGYGTYEARMRVAAAPGLNTAFFTYSGTGDKHHEIDFEFLGKDSKTVQLNFFAKGEGGHEYLAGLGFDGGSNTADYAFEWLPDRLRWFINGRQVHEARRVEGQPFPDRPQKLILSLWNGAGLDWWLGHFDYNGKPYHAAYEFVAYTKAGDPCQFPGSIVCALNARAKQASDKQ